MRGYELVRVPKAHREKARFGIARQVGVRPVAASVTKAEIVNPLALFEKQPSVRVGLGRRFERDAYGHGALVAIRSFIFPLQDGIDRRLVEWPDGFEDDRFGDVATAVDQRAENDRAGRAFLLRRLGIDGVDMHELSRLGFPLIIAVLIHFAA